ncbi:MAG: cell division protein FtsH, partial [Desulfobacterales bacterium]|nr:cell division protein FtsH [Desulfobacterales bacterium]
QIAQKMIRSWGMSETLGPLSYAQGDDQIFLAREISQHRDYSEETAKKIDAEITSLAKRAYDRAKDVLSQNRDILDKLTELLLDKETVLGSEMDDLILSLRPGIKLPPRGGAGDSKSKKNLHEEDTVL